MYEKQKKQKLDEENARKRHLERAFAGIDLS